MVFERKTPRNSASGDSEVPKAAKIAELVKRLAKSVLAKGRGQANPTAVDRSVTYALRILSSRMYPTVEKDDFQIAEAIKRKLLSRPQLIGGLNGKEAALKFEESNNRLESQRSLLTERWSVLYLLYTLTGSQLSHSTSAVDMARDQSFMTAGNGITAIAIPQPNRHLSSVGEGQQPEGKTAPPRPNKLSPSSLTLIDQNLSYQVSEEVLLREIIFTLQGIDGQHIKFSTEQNGYAIADHISVPRPVRTLVRRVCELAWMYRQVNEFVARTLAEESVGLIQQSFCGALQAELTDYYRLVAVLESQLAESLCSAGEPGNQFTLRRFYVWVEDPLERMKLMAMLCAAVKGLRGGAMASAVAAHLRHGDAMVHSFVRRVMKRLSTPLFAMIQRWVSVGELQDPYSEFFIVQASQQQLRVHDDMTVLQVKQLLRQRDGLPINRCSLALRHGKGGVLANEKTLKEYSLDHEGKALVDIVVVPSPHDSSPDFLPSASCFDFTRVPAQETYPLNVLYSSGHFQVAEGQLWRDKYSLRQAMVPSFISKPLANKILVIGKSINFIRQCCSDAKWVSDVYINFEKVFDTAAADSGRVLEVAIHQAAQVTHSRLMYLLLNKFKFAQHCLSIKRFLLLGQGDFIQVLLDLLQSELDRPAVKCSSDEFTGAVEAAVRMSNVQYDDPGLVEKLDVHLLEGVAPGADGWDVFSLKYNVAGPLNVVFTAEAISQ
mmetsp:Transcript_3609/g.6859  ORF Transcript_3609/g.6859 Transcript_3609/m.6859 type:complete len:718 (-) Transcript_3609:13-2166(-)